MEGKGQRCVQGIRATIYDNKIWMFDRWINALFSMDIETGKTEYVLSIENEPKYQEALVSHIVGYNNKLFLNPSSAQSAVLVDLETMKQTKIPLERRENICGVKNSNVVQEDSLIYMFPKLYGDDILIYDIDKGVTEKVSIDYSFLERNNISIEGFSWGCGCRVKDGYCMSIINTPGIFYLWDSGKWGYYKANTRNVGFGNCIICDNDIILLPYRGKDIMVFHVKDRGFDKLHFSKKIIGKNNVPYTAIASVKTKLVFFPAEEKNIVIYDLKTQEIILHDIFDSRFYDCKVYGELIYGFPYVGNYIIAINIDTNEIKKINMFFPNQYKGIQFVDYWINQTPYLEQEKCLYTERVLSIQDYMKYILNQDKNLNRRENNNCGLKILNDILIDFKGVCNEVEK
ncbi:MAG: hypothetical protein HFG78_02675 [Hungatella sp.]|nr:hypothetical protein [Hungatella sp.]